MNRLDEVFSATVTCSRLIRTITYVNTPLSALQRKKKSIIIDLMSHVRESENS